MLLSQIVDICNRIAPETLAEDWDNVGLQAGNPQDEVHSVLLCVEVTPKTLSEARQRDCQCILAHHPAIFRPLHSLRTDRPPANLLVETVRAGIAIYVLHTNLDVASPGVSDALATALGVVDLFPLVPIATRGKSGFYKLAVFVPVEAAQKVRDALGDAGAGVLGNYSHCSFSVTGMGSFRPLHGANPTIGSVGMQESVEEEKIEVLVPESLVPRVIPAMIRAHPYEEVAYDLYPLAPPLSRAGLGRIGRLEQPCTLAELAQRARTRLAAATVSLAGDPDRAVERVAVCGGSGGSLVDAAVASGAEVLITGDVKHHEALHASSSGLAIIDAGHYATERPVLDLLASFLREQCGDNVQIYVSQSNTDPFRQFSE